MSDLISRKNAINYMANAIWHYPNYTALNVYENAEELAKDGLANVPSAESTGAMDEAIQHYINEGYMKLDSPKGEWIECMENIDGTHNIKCNQCKEGYKSKGHAESIYTRVKYRFCPNCGAYMRGDK